MVSIAERDVLLELASGGLALVKDLPINDVEVEKYRDTMAELWRKYIDSEDDELDFKECVQEVKSLRAKYE